MTSPIQVENLDCCSLVTQFGLRRYINRTAGTRFCSLAPDAPVTEISRPFALSAVSRHLEFASFTVQCPTCSSRLRVQDPNLIGSIASCPSCHSMVQIDRPPDDTTEQFPGRLATDRRLVAGDSVDSQAITAESEQPEDANSLGVGPGGFAQTRDTPPPPAPITDRRPAEYQSEETRRKRQIAMITALSICGLLISVTAFGWFVRSWMRGQQPAIALDTDTAESGMAEPRSTEAPLPDAPEADSNVETEPNTPSEGMDEPQTNPTTTVIESPVDTASETPSQVPASLVQPWRVDQSPLPATLTQEEAEVKTADAASNTGNERATMTDLGGLAEFTPLLDLAASSFELPPTLKTPLGLTDVQLDAAAEDSLDPMMIANPPEPIELDKAMGIRLAIDSPGYRVADFGLLLSQLTGVPIHIDWPSYDLISWPVSDKIAIPKGWKSAQEILDEVAASTESEIRREDSMLVLSVTDAAFDRTWQLITDLSDFGNQTDSAIDALSGFLYLEDNDSPLTPFAGVTQREDRILAALATDAMRRMRGIEPTIQDEYYSRWAAKFDLMRDSSEPAVGHWPLLNDAVSIEQFATSETVAAVLRKTAQANDATCLINGYDARRRHLSPRQLVLPYTGQSGEEVLAQALAPFRLQVRRVDGSHWWVGTEATYDRLPVVVWTTPLGTNRESLLARFTTVADKEAGDDLRIVYDAVSDRALMLVPRYIARQLPALVAPSSDTNKD